jgi:hypothetical protein
MEHLQFPRYLPIRRTAFEFEMHLIEAEHYQPSVLRRESQRIGGGRGRSQLGRMRVSCPHRTRGIAGRIICNQQNVEGGMFKITQHIRNATNARTYSVGVWPSQPKVQRLYHSKKPSSQLLLIDSRVVAQMRSCSSRLMRTDATSAPPENFRSEPRTQRGREMPHLANTLIADSTFLCNKHGGHICDMAVLCSHP